MGHTYKSLIVKIMIYAELCIKANMNCSKKDIPVPKALDAVVSGEAHSLCYTASPPCAERLFLWFKSKTLHVTMERPYHCAKAHNLAFAPIWTVVSAHKLSTNMLKGNLEEWK